MDTPRLRSRAVDQPRESDENADAVRASSRLVVLAENLKGRGFDVKHTRGKLVVRDPHDAESDSGSRASVEIVCRPRADDGDRLWFFCGYEPITQADGEHMADAQLTISTLLARSRS